MNCVQNKVPHFGCRQRRYDSGGVGGPFCGYGGIVEGRGGVRCACPW